MAVVNHQSVEQPHGLQLDPVQLLQFKHMQDEPAKDLNCASRKVVRLAQLWNLEAAKKMSFTVNMRAQLWHMFVTIKIICSYDINLVKKVAISLQCFIMSLDNFEEATVHSCLGDFQPCCLMICQPCYLGIFQYCCLGMFQSCCLGIFPSYCLGIVQPCSLEEDVQLGCPEKGLSSLTAQKEDASAWLPRRGKYSFAAQKRTCSLVAKKRTFQLGSPEVAIQLCQPKLRCRIKFRNTNFLLLSECYS